MSAVLPSFQTSAGWRGFPVRLSQRTVVSRWLVIPIPLSWCVWKPWVAKSSATLKGERERKRERERERERGGVCCVKVLSCHMHVFGYLVKALPHWAHILLSILLKPTGKSIKKTVHSAWLTLQDRIPPSCVNYRACSILYNMFCACDCLQDLRTKLETAQSSHLNRASNLRVSWLKKISLWVFYDSITTRAGPHISFFV